MNFGFYKGIDPKRWKYLFFPLLLSLGFSIRILFSPYLSYQGDFRTWMVWAAGIANVGFPKFYDKFDWCDYMPGYIYVLWLLENVHSALPTISDTILFKLPANLSDLGISILIFLVVRSINNSKNAKIASLAYLFNPASLSNSTFWGQVDSVHAFPLLASILLGIRRRFVLSSVFAAIAFMIKPQSIVIFPLIGFFVIRDIIIRGKEDRVFIITLILLIKIIAAGIITIFVVTLPFIWDELGTEGIIGYFNEPILFINERFFTAYNKYDRTSLNAFNFWGMFAMWQSDQIRIFGITYQMWGTILFGIFYALILGSLFRYEIIGALKEQNRLGPDDNVQFATRAIYAVTLILFALFLFVTRAHERHFLPAIAFFTIIVFRSWLYWLFYGLVSLIYTVNMTYAYVWLTSRGFSSSLVEPFIPGFALVLLVVFLIVLIDFIRGSVGFYRETSS